MKTRLAIVAICFANFLSCTRPLDLEDIAYDNHLVVEAVITDKTVRQRVTLSRSIPLTADTTLLPETGANIHLIDNNGTQVDFVEISPGAYFTQTPFAGSVGGRYHLEIETVDGRAYTSAEMEMLPTPEIDSIYIEFEPNPINSPNGGLFSVRLDARSNPDQNQFYRWTWNSTFKLSVPYPSRWKWAGGNNFIGRDYGGENNHLQVEFCWKTDSSSQILITDLSDPELGIRRKEIHTFHSDSRAMNYGYSIEVKQYAISRESYEFWNLVAGATQDQGSLYDEQVGTIRSNIWNTRDPDEIVLGYFEAVQEKAVRRLYVPLDFANDGFRRSTSYYVDCADLAFSEGPVDEIGEFMEANQNVWVIGYFVTGGPVVYLLKRCADCTLYGDNKEPDFWRD